MKDKIYFVLVSMFIFWSMTTLFKGITVNQGLVGYMLVGSLFGVIMLAIPRLLRFITFKENILTSLLFSTIFTFALFVLLQYFTALIIFQDGALKGIVTPFLSIKDIPLDKNSLIAVFSILCATINTLMMRLIK